MQHTGAATERPHADNSTIVMVFIAPCGFSSVFAELQDEAGCEMTPKPLATEGDLQKCVEHLCWMTCLGASCTVLSVDIALGHCPLTLASNFRMDGQKWSATPHFADYAGCVMSVHAECTV